MRVNAERVRGSRSRDREEDEPPAGEDNAPCESVRPPALHRVRKEHEPAEPGGHAEPNACHEREPLADVGRRSLGADDRAENEDPLEDEDPAREGDGVQRPVEKGRMDTENLREAEGGACQP